MGKTSRKQRDQKRYQEELDKIRSEHQANKKELEAQRKLDPTSTRLSEEATSAATPRMSESKEMTVGVDVSPNGKTKKEKKKLELPTVEWQPGEAPETLSFPRNGVKEAYEVVKFDPSKDDQHMLLVGVGFHTLTDLEDDSQFSGPKEKNGAALLAGCSRTDYDKEDKLLDLLRLHYRREANQQLSKRRLPLPRGIDRDQLFIPLGYWPKASVWFREGWHERSLSAEESRLPLAERTKTKELKGEKSSLEANVLALKAEVKEAFEARDAKEDENEKLRDDIARLKREKELEIERLREENAKLQALSSSRPPRTTSSPYSSGKSTFVIGALSKQVKELSRELKEKNEQLAELMIELTKSE